MITFTAINGVVKLRHSIFRTCNYGEVSMSCGRQFQSWRAVTLLLVVGLAGSAKAQTQPADRSAQSMALYQTLRQFRLNGGSAVAENVVLKRDRVEITFNGTFYFEEPLDGSIRGAVFVGSGKVHADAPNSAFEQDNLRRMLHASAVDSDFKTAVLRFSDDTVEAMGLKIEQRGGAPDDAQKLASTFSNRLLEETGANVDARTAVSILNRENPGVFIAECDKGARGRFDLILDDQGRLPSSNFDLDGGEKGLFFAYDNTIDGPDVWMAFYSLADYQKGIVEYSDAHALVNVSHYDMDVDVRDWKHMKLETRITMTSSTDGLLAIPFMMNETLPSFDSMRLKKALRLKSARLENGSQIAAIQEDWDGGVTLLLSEPLAKGQSIQPILDFEGDFLIGDPTGDWDARYVLGDCWYPRHVDLNRASYDVVFHHKKGTKVASLGEKVREEETGNHDMLTEWKMDVPIALTTFAVGDFTVYNDKAKMQDGKDLELDFYRLSPTAFNFLGGVKTDFVLAEMNNCVRYFSALFGPYPYSRFGATYRPFPFGQGFATMLMLPKSDRADQYTYSFIAHETSHQWWGDLVLWRSYRDQWLSEGFADYSGVLYTERRDSNRGDSKELLRLMHDELVAPPETLTGVGQGRLADIGPLILGSRLNTRETNGAYSVLIYKKGALVLRMLDFLFTDPSTGDDKAFFDMMKDFVSRYANRAASTENFISVANEHFATSPIARSYGVKDLNWFFKEWVYEAVLPSYQFSYWTEKEADGSALIHGTLEQSDAPAQWAMPLPLVMHFGKDKIARGIVFAVGNQSQMTLHAPTVPDNVELDPERWVLSDRTTTVKIKK
jgi:hypothetical protein